MLSEADLVRYFREPRKKPCPKRGYGDYGYEIAMRRKAKEAVEFYSNSSCGLRHLAFNFFKKIENCHSFLGRSGCSDELRKECKEDIRKHLRLLRNLRFYHQMHLPGKTFYFDASTNYIPLDEISHEKPIEFVERHTGLKVKRIAPPVDDRMFRRIHGYLLSQKAHSYWSADEDTSAFYFTDERDIESMWNAAVAIRLRIGE